MQLERQSPSLSFLKQLMSATLKTFPLENLDFYYKVSPPLNVEHLIERMLFYQKGGNSLQLHAVFFEALKQLGFSCALHSVHKYHPEQSVFGDRLTHSSIIILLSNARYYIDLGSIMGPIIPLEMIPLKIMLSDTSYYRWEKRAFDDHLYLTMSKDASTFSQIQQVEHQPTQLISFLPVYERYTNVDNEEAKRRYLFRRTNAGYVLIENNQFTQKINGLSSSKNISNEDEFWSLVDQHFHIDRDQFLSQAADL